LDTIIVLAFFAFLRSAPLNLVLESRIMVLYKFTYLLSYLLPIHFFRHFAVGCIV